MIICDRCGNKDSFFKMSFFNTDMCCQLCIEEEEAHPDFSRAKQAELEEVLKGNYNFPGIGLPKELHK